MHSMAADTARGVRAIGGLSRAETLTEPPGEAGADVDRTRYPMNGPPGDNAVARRRRPPKRPVLPIAILTGAFAVSRLIAAAAGVRFDSNVLDGTRNTDMWQLLDVRLLKYHLIESVWHLNSQPPLFNLYCGLVLKLPAGMQVPFEVVSALILGLAIVLCTYLLMVELGVPRLVAVLVTLVCVVASPAYILYENWLNYSYPTAAFGVIAAWCLVRYLRTRQPSSGSGSSSATGPWSC